MREHGALRALTCFCLWFMFWHICVEQTEPCSLLDTNILSAPVCYPPGDRGDADYKG